MEGNLGLLKNRQILRLLTPNYISAFHNLAEEDLSRSYLFFLPSKLLASTLKHRINRKSGLAMSEKCLATVEIDLNHCCRCYVCKSICPYEAIKADETGKVEVSNQDCQV